MSKKQKDSGKEFVWGKRKKKTWMIVTGAVVVVAAAALGFIVFGFDFDDATSPSTKDTQDSSVVRAIDGVAVAADEANLYPVAVVIENLVVSRPQSGLASANLVYEALAEGGVTRFLAIFAGDTVGVVGPVRSARPYFVDWVLEYNALFAHAGGSPQALADIQSKDVFDLNQFFNSQYFYRDYSRDVALEHTLYTTGENLTFALRDLEADAEGDYDLWKYKTPAAAATRPIEEKTITIDYSSFSYAVEYRYDADTNQYVRYMAGQIHADADGTEIRPTNVVVQKVKTRLADEQRLSMETVGEGEAVVFRDGVATAGTWKKDKSTERTRFYDADNNEIEFNPGQTWIEVVPTDRDVVYN